MRVKAKHTIKHHPYYLSPGDVVSVDDVHGAIMVKNGWAENADTGESVQPSTSTVDVIVDDAAHTATDKGV